MTVSNLYCSRADVNKRLPLGSVQSPAGIVASAIASTDVITYDGHGFETDDLVNVRAAQDGTLPAPLSSSVTYYAIRQNNSTFKLALTAGGAAIDLTTNGDEVIVSREPNYDEIIEFYSRWADTFMPAHAVPFTAPVPVLVKGLVADLSAKRILNVDGKSSASVDEAEAAAAKQLERFATGIPVDMSTTPRTNLAVTSQLGKLAVSDPRGWDRFGDGGLP